MTERPPFLLVVDVCGTLYDENTTAGFVRFHARLTGQDKRIDHRIIDVLRCWPLRHVIVIVGRLINRDLFRRWYIGRLKGLVRDELQNTAVAYAEYLQEKQRISVVHERLAELVCKGWSPILVSNSLDIVVEAIASRLEVPFLASELSFEDGVCAGRLFVDLKGKKQKALTQYFNTSSYSDRITIITDNRSDLDVIAIADKAILVAKGNAKNWMTELDAEILYH